MLKKCLGLKHQSFIANGLASLLVGVATFGAMISRADTIQNGPITAASVELNGVATATTLPDGTILGEPGILLRKIGPDEEPTEFIAIASGRLSNTGIVRWDAYLPNFKLGFYLLADYTNGVPPFVTLSLQPPTDSSNNVITTTSPDGASVLPATANFASLLSTTNLLTRYGYWLGFDLTTHTQLVNATTTYVPPTLLSTMRTSDVVMTFWTVSDFANDGGTRIGAQEPGFGQVGPLDASVFKSVGQFPGIIADGSAGSYALELRTKTSFVPASIGVVGTTSNGVASTWTNVAPPIVYTVAVASASSPWTWSAAGSFTATGTVHTWTDTNITPTRLYRLER